MDRRAQLRELYGLDFPDELFAFWEWFNDLDADMHQAFVNDAGMRPSGVCDVLAGKFDGVELMYPAVLHWRYRLDHPELITVLSGDTDGLHWGFWFDDPATPPVIAANYARDAYEFWVAGASLFDAIGRQIKHSIEGSQENLESDPQYADDYKQTLASLRALAALVPAGVSREKRKPIENTADGMGIVVPSSTWDVALAKQSVAPESLLEAANGWINRGKAGVALYHAKQLLPKDHELACRALEQAYTALGRDALATIARTHREYPSLPSVNVLDYRRGDYTEFAAALAAASAVRKLEVGGQGLTTLPDLSSLSKMEELVLWGNALAELPDSLAACKDLRQINLFRNQLNVFPTVLCRLPRLAELQLGKNQIAIIVDEIRSCHALRSLDLAGNPLADLPAALAELPMLTTLNLSETPLTRLPEEMGRQRSLRYLALSGTKLATLPSDLSGWCGLERIDVVRTALSPSELSRLAAAAPNATIVR